MAATARSPPGRHHGALGYVDLARSDHQQHRRRDRRLRARDREEDRRSSRTLSAHGLASMGTAGVRSPQPRLAEKNAVVEVACSPSSSTVGQFVGVSSPRSMFMFTFFLITFWLIEETSGLAWPRCRVWTFSSAGMYRYPEQFVPAPELMAARRQRAGWYGRSEGHDIRFRRERSSISSTSGIEAIRSTSSRLGSSCRSRGQGSRRQGRGRALPHGADQLAREGQAEVHRRHRRSAAVVDAILGTRAGSIGDGQVFIYPSKRRADSRWRVPRRRTCRPTRASRSSIPWR